MCYGLIYGLCIKKLTYLLSVNDLATYISRYTVVHSGTDPWKTLWG